MHILKKYLLSAPILSCVTALAQSGPAPSSNMIPQLDHLDLSQVDRSVEPCNDFYQFACKKWIANNPIPPDQASWWLGTKLMIWNQTVVRQILEEASNGNAKRNPTEQKIGDYYASCMNEAEINNKGIAAIQAELDRINAMKSKAQLPGELEKLLSSDHVLLLYMSEGRPYRTMIWLHSFKEAYKKAVDLLSGTS